MVAKLANLHYAIALSVMDECEAHKELVISTAIFTIYNFEAHMALAILITEQSLYFFD